MTCPIASAPTTLYSTPCLSTTSEKVNNRTNGCHRSRRPITPTLTSSLFSSTQDNNPTTSYFDPKSSSSSSLPLRPILPLRSTYRQVNLPSPSKQDFATHCHGRGTSANHHLDPSTNQSTHPLTNQHHLHPQSSPHLRASIDHQPQAPKAAAVSVLLPLNLKQVQLQLQHSDPYPSIDNYYVLPSNMSAALPLLSPLVTKILELSGFPPELKTRDIHQVFQQWEEDRGGFKIKWRDDTTALIVFNDPAVAKRAYLQTLLSPPPSLMTSSGVPAKVRPYDGDDASQVISMLSNRPRGRSNAGNREQAPPAYGGGSPKGGEAMLSNGSGSGSNQGSTSPQKPFAKSNHHLASPSSNLGHRRNNSGSNPSLLPPKPVAAALFDAANGGPSPASHIVNGERERMEKEGLLASNGDNPDPLAAAIDAARVGHTTDSARSGKGRTLGEVNAQVQPENADVETDAAEEGDGKEKKERSSAPRIDDAGKRLVAGALGKRLPNSSERSSSPTSGSVEAVINGLDQLSV